jgi:hypothetical protein
MSDKRWAWSEHGDPEAHGLFASKTEAISDAVKYYWKHYPGITEVTINIGKVVFAEADHYVASDIGDLSERLRKRAEQAARDDYFEFFDGEVFQFNSEFSEKERNADLSRLVSEWAKKYIVSGRWVLVDYETVKL